jgi:hypothetical protein
MGEIVGIAEVTAFKSPHSITGATFAAIDPLTVVPPGAGMNNATAVSAYPFNAQSSTSPPTIIR